MLVRHHRRQRMKLFVPDNQNMPIPLKNVDVTRNTETSLESPSEKHVMDYWNIPCDNPAGGDPMPADRQLSEPWTGRTIFYLLRQPLPEGYEWVMGRPTKKQKSNRPPTIWPEFWKHYPISKKSKQLKNGHWKNQSSKQLKPHVASKACQKMTKSTLPSSTKQGRDWLKTNPQQCYACHMHAMRGVTPALTRGG